MVSRTTLGDRSTSYDRRLVADSHDCETSRSIYGVQSFVGQTPVRRACEHLLRELHSSVYRAIRTDARREDALHADVDGWGDLRYGMLCSVDELPEQDLVRRSVKMDDLFLNLLIDSSKIIQTTSAHNF